MAITNGYATLAEIKTYLSTTSTNDDARLERAIESASRSIDATCRRRFYGTTETKYIEASADDFAWLPDDLRSVTELAIDDGLRTYTALSPSDYELEPFAAPHDRVYISPTSDKIFPLGRRGLRLNGAWGYCATGSHPDAIKQSCLILAVRYFKRRDAAFGVLGTPELGFQRIMAKDPEVKNLLMPFVKVEIVGA